MIKGATLLSCGLLCQKMVMYPQFMIILVLSNFLGLARTQDTPAPFIVRAERDVVERNILTMTCTSTSTGDALPNSLFFLNGSNLEERGDLAVARSGESIVFLLRQDLEGDYTCGRRIDSNNIQFSLPIQFVGEFCICMKPQMQST